MILITSALPYVNNIPHLGNIIGCVLSADVFSRYCHSRGYDCIYICGTDEYGTATETKALEEGVTPQDICDKYYRIHKEIYEWFNIKFDIFGRTTNPQHKEITQEIFLKLYRNGYIQEQEVEQVYCPKCESFRADRYVEGTCPHCSYEHARGDQCEKCGKLLNPEELLDAKCKVCSGPLEVRPTKHLFIDLPKSLPKLEAWIEKAAKEGFWSENSLNIARAWIKEGLKPRAISRDLKWGIPIPLAGYEKKVFYVWFDAPIGYISITASLTPSWKDWWQNPEGVRLYQFMGKDNVPFHTVIFPSTLLGTGDPWTLLYHINTTEFLNYEGGKFSKSRSQGVFGTDARESGIPADVWRYYLLTNRPEKADTNFTWPDFGEKLNSELLANLGNLVNRTLVFIERYYGGKIPALPAATAPVPGGTGAPHARVAADAGLSKEGKAFWEAEQKACEKITALLEEVKLKDGLHEIMYLGKNANGFFQAQQPWKARQENPAKAAEAIYLLAHAVKDLAILCEPYLPATSARIFGQLGIAPRKWDDRGKLSLPAAGAIGKPEPLFQKIEESQLKALHKKFAGEQKGKDEPVPQAAPYGVKQGEAGAASSPSLVGRLDLEVAKIIEAKQHPNAEKLYILQLELGAGERRQIVAGIAPYYRLEELPGRNLILVKNLKPAKLRGEVSQGMLLAAESPAGEVEFISPERSSPGEKVTAEGITPQPAKEVEFAEFKQIKLEVRDGQVFADGYLLRSASEPIATKKVREGIAC